MVHNGGGEGHFTQACAEHKFALASHANLFNPLQFYGNLVRVAPRTAHDVVFQGAIFGRVVAYIHPPVGVLVPDFLEAAHVRCRSVAGEVVGCPFVRGAALHFHGIRSASKEHLPAMPFLPPRERARGTAILDFFFDGDAFGLALKDGSRIKGGDYHALGRGHGLAHREFRTVEHRFGELASVLHEMDFLVMLIQ